jgi:hypothetical protein
MEHLPDITDSFTPDILLAIAEVQEPRTPFQISNFVVGQHDTKEMQYYQTVIELQQLYYTIRTVTLEMKKTEIEIKRLRETGDEIDDLETILKDEF